MAPLAVAIAKTNEQRKVINRAERLLGKPMPELTDELFLEFSRNGNRSRCQRVLSQRHGRRAVPGIGNRVFHGRPIESDSPHGAQ